jgi:NitT/TauT family transport system permease protein
MSLVTAGASRTGTSGWSALPRRRPPRPRPAVFVLRRPIGRRTGWALMALSIVGALAGWWLLSISGLVQPAHYLPTPAATLSAGIHMLESGQLWDDTLASMTRVLKGFGLAVAVSVPLGIVMGSFAAGWSLFEPVIGVLRYLPAAAFIPLLIIWLGLEEEPKIAVIFLGTFFFNTLMTADVVRGVPMPLIDVSYTLGARTGDVIRKVIIPHSLPGMIDAVRVNAAAAWSFVVVAELIAAQSGLGYRINRMQRLTQVDKIFALLVVIGLIGLTMDVLLRVLRDRVGRWV